MRLSNISLLKYLSLHADVDAFFIILYNSSLVIVKYSVIDFSIVSFECVSINNLIPPSKDIISYIPSFVYW